ncbi:Heat shock protein HSP1 [uncultured Butyricicoccus sp.]|uniref:ATP-dependent Clp protease ATP-binding subunit n=1 Tax=Agathobaculum ammoniilyticum TaxID=2981778 RepID=A0ABT2U456_9FIRM|nr:ATP-dependent Clp protease ATP-binding subunit [Agathobaculum ammoniilyticum]MCU6788772.1 ATP-dependent Clp protease ATP-binding subunit [Agathobaculum ammoniilyticum]SCI92306.1 Heat shock protein HSP1 [uncultured Butyricicoccus sp.]
MNMPMCSRCKKNIAVVFITKIEGPDKTTQEGLCLKCARELGVKPLDNIMEQMGITEDDLEALSGEIGSLSDLNDLVPAGSDGADDDAPHETDPAAPVPSSPAPPLPPQTPLRDSARTRTQAPPREDKKRKYLNNYCENLTRKAAEGRIDHIVGRDRETDRVIQILNRRQKNNPCLIGEPGVGKTAVAEGLAVRINEGKVPFKMRNKEVHLLDLTALVAGTQFRGQFESRMKGLIDEVKKLGNIILVIDEVHNIVGAGDSEGSMNAANILKPALARGDIQVIGATTLKEYRKYIEKDAALERRFQPVYIGEPSVAETTEILKGIRSYYETFHGVTVSDEMCRRAAEMSERYITDRFLPDKAIDLIDEACSRLNLDSPQLSEIPALQAELESLQTQLDLLTQSSARTDQEDTYARIAACRQRLLQVEGRLHELLTQPAPAVDEQLLASVIEIWTGIPASKVAAQESARLRDMESRLKSHVIGQDEAVDAVCASIRRSRAGISPKRKPASFLFVGPTGVGKTELVKQLALDLFDSPDALVRLDMSEYMEKHTVSRLIGSPPGYVGYDEAGQLTEKIRRRPYSVVLFDEIEKAHPDVLNALLQILDDGRLTDAHGRVVSFENTVIVMTSNAGSATGGTPAGFGRTVSQQSKERAMKALEDIMRPEFLNRIDEIIAFNQLTNADFRRIATIMLGELRDTLAGKQLRLTWDDTLLDYLTEKSFSIKFGARNLRRLIEKEIENPLATAIVTGERPLSGAYLHAGNGRIILETI